MSRSSSDSAITLAVSSTPDTVPGSSVSTTSSTPRMPRRSQTPPPSPPSPPFPSFVSSTRSIHHSAAYPFMPDHEAVERRRLRKVKKLEEKLAWEESCRKEREVRNRREVEEWERKQQEIKAAAAVTAVATTITTISIEAPPMAPTPNSLDVPADEAILTPVVAIESPGPEPTPIQVQTASSIPPPLLVLPESGSSERAVNVDRRIEIEILDSDSDSDDEIQIIEPCPKPVVSSRASLPNSRLLPIIGPSTSSTTIPSSNHPPALSKTSIPISRRSNKALFIPPVKKIIKTPMVKPKLPSLPKSMRAHLNGDPAEERKKLEDQFEWEKNVMNRRRKQEERRKNRAEERNRYAEENERGKGKGRS